jgi:hypothetical protein
VWAVDIQAEMVRHLNARAKQFGKNQLVVSKRPVITVLQKY